MFVKYLISGLFNTAVAFGTYYYLVQFVDVAPWLANIAGVGLSFLSGFVLSKMIVFQSTQKTSHVLVLKYAAVLLAQYIVGTIVIYMAIRFGFSKIEAYVIALPIMIIISFVLQRYWVFDDA